MIKLIADSGSSKAEWCLLDGKKKKTFITQGLSPYFLTSEQIQFILHDSGVKIVFVSTLEQMRKVRSLQNQTSVEKIVVMDELPAKVARALKSGPLRVAVDIPRRRFEDQWRQFALKFRL